MSKNAFAQSSQETLSTEAKEIKERLGASVFGQDSALETIAKALTSNDRAYIYKPQASLLLTGKGCVGKTETAKQIAKVLSRDLTILHMNEFDSPYSVGKLIGVSSLCNKGHEKASLLKAAANKPSVLLLDEFDKADDPRTLGIIRDILEHGQTMDVNGDTLDFKNAIVIVISSKNPSEVIGRFCNESPRSHQHSVGFNQTDDTRGDYALERRLKAEKMFDTKVEFQPVDSAAIKKIVERKLAEVSDKFKETQGHKLEIAPQVAQSIADQALGEPRKIPRLVSEKILEPLANGIITGFFDKRDVSVTYDRGEIRFGHQYPKSVPTDPSL